MKIFGICLIKNEADIIAETLEYAVSWCDHIIVDDNGSEDGTWEIVQELAAKHPQIIPWRQKRQPYHDKLRAEAFNEFRHLSKAGDWWTKLDSDERYTVDPKRFLAEVPRRYHVVWGIHLQYYFTEAELEDWNRWMAEGTTPPPVHERLRHYRCDSTEARFFRYRQRLVWPANASWPVHLGIPSPRRIPVCHFQYRSPEQIQKRLETRQLAMREGCGTFKGYCEEKSWRDKIVDPSTCVLDKKDGCYQVDEAAVPMAPEPTLRRVARHILHGTGIWP